MAKEQTGDGVYKRRGRKGYFISWIDAQGQRRHRKTGAHTLQQARAALAREKINVEQARVLGFNPPGSETFAEVSTRYLKYQKARLSLKAYDRTRGESKANSIPRSLARLQHSEGQTCNATSQSGSARCPLAQSSASLAS
jgi:hypothetical protein